MATRSAAPRPLQLEPPRRSCRQSPQVTPTEFIAAEAMSDGSPTPIPAGTARPRAKSAMTPDAVASTSTLAVPVPGAPGGTFPYEKTLNSPCFVHAHLDQSLSDFVKRKAAASAERRRASSTARRRSKVSAKPAFDTASAQGPIISQRLQIPPPFTDEDSSDGHDGRETDDDDGSDDDKTEGEEPESLTMQLAETATSVREMSKQLGRARVKSAVQSVLIITKARDNHLIRLTRELAVWLMGRKSDAEKPMVVYVDHQLRRSKRFDLPGLQRDHPDFFRPLSSRHPHTRRSSRSSTHLSSSSTSLVNGYSGSESAKGPAKFHMTKMTPSRASSGSETAGSTSSSSEEGQLRYWTAEMCTQHPELFDFVVTLGGDGTVLFASWLFQRVVPPVIPFALGSLGFLTNFDFDSYPAVMDQAIDAGVRVNLRMRFTCTVFRAVDPITDATRRAIRSGQTGEIFMQRLGQNGWQGLEDACGGSGSNSPGMTRLEKLQKRDATPEKDAKTGGFKDKEIMCFHTKPVESFEVLNELVVDRGPSPYVSLLELFGDEHHMTTVQADGLTVSTPTGSTAYSLSAGGSLVHPEIPALLITPICPHTLSFRPMLLPDSMELRICVPYNSRSTAWASFDGRGRVELRQGDHIKVTASRFPMPTVCADKQSTDWFEAISRTLKWNERQRQKSFVVVEQQASPSDGKKGATVAQRKEAEATQEAMSKEMSHPRPQGESKEDGKDDKGAHDGGEDDDDEGFDIDDVSSANGSKEDDDTEKQKAKSPPPPPHGMIEFLDDQGRADDDTRFMDPVPKPPKLSSRHSHRDRLLHSSDEDDEEGDGGEAKRRERGDVGDRDDLRESLEVKTRNRRRSNAPKPPLVVDLPEPPGAGPASAKKVVVPEELRAFVVRGHDQDLSDASLSEGEGA